jgi:hypothetical protein
MLVLCIHDVLVVLNAIPAPDTVNLMLNVESAQERYRKILSDREIDLLIQKSNQLQELLVSYAEQCNLSEIAKNVIALVGLRV